jgi:flagellar hook assembly protein FlgD
MSITAVNSATAAGERGMSSLKSEDFFNILVTELQNQDPFEPQKTSDMISQVSQIRSIELSQNLTDTLQTLSNRQQTAGVSDLLGKFVASQQFTEDGTPYYITGIVTGVRFDSDGAAVLELDTGQAVLASNVTHVTTAEMAELMMNGGSSDDDADDSDNAKQSDDTSKRVAGTGQSAQTQQPQGLLGYADAWFKNLLGV